jgi:hypothetical protein
MRWRVKPRPEWTAWWAWKTVLIGDELVLWEWVERKLIEILPADPPIEIYQYRFPTTTGGILAEFETE